MSKKLIFRKKIEIVDDKERVVIKPLRYTISDDDLANKSELDTKYGAIKIDDVKIKNKITTSMGKNAYVIEETFIDKYRRIKKLAQTIPLKDIGYIITTTGLGKSSIVGESGCGSGGVSCFLANFVKEIRSYDINEKHIEITNRNIKFLNLDNVFVKNSDVYDELDIDDNYFDVFVLDVPEPIKAFSNVLKKVKSGGFIVSYSPSITQNLKLVNYVDTLEDIEVIKTNEMLNRVWKVHKDVAKPLDLEIGHSGFMTLFRKLN